MPKEKAITITFIVSGGKGQSIETYPSQKLNELKLKIAKKLFLSKEKAVILTYKNKDLFEDQQTLNNLQINDKSILYIRVVEKINLQTSHKLGQSKMKKSLNMQSQDQKKQDKNQQLISKNRISSKEFIQQHPNQKPFSKQINDFSIFVQVQAKKYNFHVNFLMKIFQLKAIIQKKVKIENKILLKFNNMSLQDSKAIGDYQINEYQLLNCIFVGQQKNNEQNCKAIHFEQIKNQSYFKNFQVETKQIKSEEQCFQKLKKQNPYVNKLQAFFNCDLKKSQIIDDQCEQITQQQDQQYKSPLTPQYTHNSKDFSTPYTPSFNLNLNSKTSLFSLFQKSQQTSKVWNGEIIETESIAFIQQNQNIFLQNQFQSCFLYCIDDNQRKQYCFQCNNQVKLEDIRTTLSKLQKAKNIIIQLQEQILEQLNQQNFLIVDYCIVSKAKQLKWVYKISEKQHQQH